MLQSLQIPTYASYVWSCYGLTLLALVWLLWYTRSSLNTELAAAQRRLQSAAHRAAANSPTAAAEDSQS